MRAIFLFLFKIYLFVSFQGLGGGGREGLKAIIIRWDWDLGRFGNYAAFFFFVPLSFFLFIFSSFLFFFETFDYCFFHI